MLSHGRGRKTNKLKCGMEGVNVIAYGRQPSPRSLGLMFSNFAEKTDPAGNRLKYPN